jgi:glycosyltransferase involved in cell wall biosynthesis
MNTKQRLKILLCNEASFLSTGYSVYGKELLSRLHSNPLFHVAELACYGFVNDPRDKDISWRYYANAVKSNDSRFQEYSANAENAFGRWRFEKTLLDFQPDVVIDIRDYWMNSYQAFSPMRKCYHWMLMPTVDSYPQQEMWLDTYSGADSIFTYSDWARDILLQQTNNTINYVDTASPGIDTQKYTMLDTNASKASLSIPTDSIVLGSVMRNQKRKLIPELIKSFRLLVDRLEKEQSPFANKVFLYLHTGYPDYLGWNIPSLLKENRLLNKVLLTYTCKNCNKVFADVYSGSTRNCIYCNNHATFPSVTAGVTQEQLVGIYNAFDLYIQYSICEGFGMPQVEAAACGVPIVTIPYSAMEDIVSKLNAYPVNIATMFKELETEAYRAYPDNDSLVNILYDYIHIPNPMKFQQRIKTRELCIKHFNWENIILKWENRLTKLFEQKQQDPINKYEQIKDWKIHSPLSLELINSSKDPDLAKLQHICTNYLNGTHTIDSYFILNILQKLTQGYQNDNQKVVPYSWKDAIEYFNTIIRNNNTIVSFIKNNNKINEDFIEYAHIKESHA